MVSWRGLPSASARNQHLILALVALLLGIALIAPLWGTRLESPQYHGEEALKVSVFAGRLTGDLREIQTLNQYVGVHIPTNIPELKFSRPVIAGFLVLTVLVCFLPARHRRRGSLVLFVWLFVFLTTALLLLQYRLYELGHVRSKGILTSIKDFTPLVIGTQKIGNFTVSSYPEIGGWSLLAAMVLSGFAAFVSKKKVAEETGETDHSNAAAKQISIHKRNAIEWQSTTKV
jgi:hypothetical protein